MTEIYLVTAIFQGVEMTFDAFENKADAIEQADALNKASGNENARIKSLNLMSSKSILKNKVKEMASKGMPQRQIASELNIGLGTVNKYLRGMT